MFTTRIGAALAALVMSAGGLLVAAPADAGTAPQLLVYGHHDLGVEIHHAPMVSRRLPGAPASFQRFVRHELRHLHRVGHCDPAAIGISVNRVRTDGFARGAVNDCGGYVAIWKQVDGRWQEILGTQDIWSCRELRRNGVPASVVRPDARCYDGRAVVRYHHA